MSTQMYDVEVTVNGKLYRGTVEARKLLVDFLREDVGLTGTKVGCEHGVCGACTIQLDGLTVRSCLTLAVQADGSEIRTVEALSSDGELSALQSSFTRHHALQCGFCTPGMLMTADEIVSSNASLDDDRIRDLLSGNLCRCTGYQNIVAAIQDVMENDRTVADRSA